MKSKFSKEILLHSLPDYISDKIKDNELKEAIEGEIQSNPDFETEYIEICNTLNFLDNTDLQSPGENYFNNLSVKINDKINSEEIRESIWDKLGLIGKILVPVISIIVIVLLIYNFTKNDHAEAIVTQDGIEKNTDPVVKTDLTANPEDMNLNKEDELKIKRGEMINSQQRQKNPVRKTVHLADTQDIYKNTEGVVLSDENIETSEDDDDEILSNFMAENNTDITDADNDEDILFLKEDEENYEEELLDFTPEEQNEIIQNLKKTQI